MEVAFKKLLMDGLIWCLRFLDTIFEMFGVLCGIDTVTRPDGSHATLFDIFFSADTVTQVFLAVFLLSIIICFVAVIVSIARNMINIVGKERKSIGRTLGQGLYVLCSTLVVAAVMTTAISVANLGLATLNKSVMKIGGYQSVGNAIFQMCVEESVVFEKGKIPETDENGFPKVDSFGNYIYKLKYDDNNNIVYEPVLDPVTGEPVLNEDGTPQMKVVYEEGLFPVQETDKDGKPMFDENGFPIYKIRPGFDRRSPYVDNTTGQLIDTFDINDRTWNADKVFGDFRGLAIFETKDDYKLGTGILYMDSFNFFIGYFGVLIMIVAVAASLLGLVKRLYDIMILYFALPIMTATLPLDDGARFKKWRETVVSKVILAYGAVFSVNTYLIVSNVILKSVDFYGTMQNAFLASLFKLFLVLGGGLAINGGQMLFARLFGTSAEENREMIQSARTLLAAGGIAAGAVLLPAKMTHGAITRGASGAITGSGVAGVPGAIAGALGGAVGGAAGGAFRGGVTRNSQGLIAALQQQAYRKNASVSARQPQEGGSQAFTGTKKQSAQNSFNPPINLLKK